MSCDLQGKGRTSVLVVSSDRPVVILVLVVVVEEEVVVVVPCNCKVRYSSIVAASRPNTLDAALSEMQEKANSRPFLCVTFWPGLDPSFVLDGENYLILSQ